jgi:hypothetical protein
MKLFSVLGATPLLYGVAEASNISKWCKATKTDSQECIDVAKRDTWNCKHLDFDCYQRNYDISVPEARNVADEAFVNEEFLASIGEDPMMQEVLGQLNAIEQQLESIGYVAPINDEEEGHFDEQKQQEMAAAGKSLGGNQTMSAAQADLANGEGQTLKRFVELKQLVSWLQPKDKRISRYCFYGCWCLPEGAHSFIAGEGHPVDLVDRACQLFWFCYQCAKQEMTANVAGKQRTCDPEKTKYTFRFKYNKQKPNDYKDRDVICKDNWYNPMDNREKWKSNCAKAFCECDRGIAMRLYKSWKHWDKSRHRIWSQRVTQCPRKTNCENMPVATARQRADREACLKKGCLFIVSERCLYGAGGANDEDSQPICCGVYEDDGSRWEMRDHGGRYNCCNHNVGTGFGDKLPWNGAWYNTITHCCHNGQVESAGGPNC